jgi:hypothetical protein
VSSIREFFLDVDFAWSWPTPRRHRLDLIGSAALMLAEPRYERGTKDGDVYQTSEVTPELGSRLVEVAGRDSEIHRRTRMYIDIVPNGVPFLPHAPVWVLLGNISRMLSHFELYALDVVDVVVSKLKPFRPRDRDDIQAMVNYGHVPHGRLVERFRSAIDESGEERRPLLESWVANLNRVERDMLDVPESEIELPPWI